MTPAPETTNFDKLAELTEVTKKFHSAMDKVRDKLEEMKAPPSPETIAAVIEHLEKEGWKVVPKVMTAEMKADAALAVNIGFHYRSPYALAANAYRSALSAAPAYAVRNAAEKGGE